MPNRLFIGGPADGELLECDESQDTYFYRYRREDTPPEEFLTATYHVEKIHGRRKSFIFFTMDILNIDDVMDYLTKGYGGNYESREDETQESTTHVGAEG